MIDEKKLIEDINEELCADCSECICIGHCSVRLIKKLIRKQPKVGEWIPIGQYPSEPCLLCFEDGRMVSGYYDYDFEVWKVQSNAGDYYTFLYTFDSGEPIAWQPLPEPYKGGE